MKRQASAATLLMHISQGGYVYIPSSIHEPITGIQCLPPVAAVRVCPLSMLAGTAAAAWQVLASHRQPNLSNVRGPPGGAAAQVSVLWCH